jgi:transcriptional regulator with XRE-family HTH domain
MPKQNRMPVERRIGQRIKELRAQTPYSQEALAARSDLDRTYINSVETHRLKGTLWIRSSHSSYRT